MSSFQGKTVWLTGASSGIGEALAMELSRRGAKLILSARREQLLQQVRNNCVDSSSHQVLPLDLSDARQAVAEVEDWGQLDCVDVLINNAGLSQRAYAVDTVDHVDRHLMEVNYFSAVALTKAVLPHMLRRRQGHVVAIGSVMSKIGTPYRSAYAASKHALQGFFDCLRAEVHDQGVRVTLVHPGFVKTPISYSALTADGTPLDQMAVAQAKAMSADEFARRALRGIERGGDDLLIGGRELWGVFLQRCCPSLFRRLVRRVKVT